MFKNKCVIFGACNPMIDITANVNNDFLDKYNLLPNNAILGDKSNYSIYDELKSKFSDSIQYTSGGSGQNTLRTLTWILNNPNIAVFAGCVGEDKYAEILKDKARETGLKTMFQTTDKYSTATCAVLLTSHGKNRSLVCHLNAANYFTADFLDRDNNWSTIENIRLFYITGFFFTVCYDAVLRLAQFAHQNDRLFCLNLSALFLTEFYKKEFIQILPYVDILFGNDQEATSFAKNILNVQTTDIRKICKKIANMTKMNNKRKRIVVITRAEKPVIFCNANKLGEVAVPKIEQDKIIDTSSAGDAFVGGFLAQYIKCESIEKCIDCGIWASGLIIQRSGCTFPSTMDYV